MRLIALAPAVATLAFACPANAQTFTGNAEVTVITPLSVVQTAGLNFGSILPSAANGTVTIDPFTEARTTTGGAAQAGGTVSAGKFTGLSDGSTHLKIDVPNGSITITRVGGGATMLVDNFGINGNKNNWVPGSTVYSFNVGARLRVNANQMTGVYTGTYTVTVNYR